jgi:hypothetical protein
VGQAMAPIARIFLLTMALLPLGLGAAHGEGTINWKKVGGWDIRIDKSLNYGCFMLGIYNKGEIIRIGIDQKRLNGYVIIGNARWRSLEVGKQYQLVLDFEAKDSWRGTATAGRIGNGAIPFLQMKFTKPGFLADLAQQSHLTIRYNNKVVSKLNLSGTYAAVQEMAHCQKVVETVRRQSIHADPFASNQPKPDPSTTDTLPSADPFK